MSFKNILLQLSTYPDPTPDNVVSASLAIAKMFGGDVTAAVCQVELPDTSNRLVSLLTDVTSVIAAARRDGAVAAASFKRKLTDVGKTGYPSVTILDFACSASRTGSQLMGCARLSDLVIISNSDYPAYREIAEEMIFGSGRPVLLLPDKVAAELKLAVVIVAWDGSRVAARAISDALPFLKFAQTVRLVEMTGEKPLEGASSIMALRTQLESHDVTASVDTIEVGDASAGEVLTDYCARQHADLLVMGAYGHTRIRDFVLGGVTKFIVHHTPLPVLLSH